MQKFNFFVTAMKQYLFLLFFIIGCRNQQEEYEENLCVYSYLCPNLAQQTVYVDKVYKMTEIIPKDTFAISGANCIIYNDDTVHLYEKFQGVYVSPPSWKLKPKNTYRIEVRYQDYIVKGKTTVPDTFSIISLVNYDTIDVPSDKQLIWSHSENSKIYAIWLLVYGDTTQKIIPELGDTTFPLTPFVTFDTILPIFADTSKFDTSGLYTIKIIALDENIYERMKNIDPAAIDTLDGGLGFIGSISFDTVTVYIKK